jgi:hypothetical protein
MPPQPVHQAVWTCDTVFAAQFINLSQDYSTYNVSRSFATLTVSMSEASSSLFLSGMVEMPWKTKLRSTQHQGQSSREHQQNLG